MDGIGTENSDIIMLASTNRADMLDKGNLLRGNDKTINISRLSPKLLWTYRIVENWGITMAPIVLRLTSWKTHPHTIWNSHFLPLKTKITLLYCKCDRVNQNKRNSQTICEKVKFDKDLNWLGMSFSWCQSQR